MPLPRVMKPWMGSPGIGMAALREAHEEIPYPLHPDPTRLGRLGRGDRRQRRVPVVEDAQAHHHLLGGDRAVADGGEEVLDGLVTVSPGDLGDPVETHRLDAGAGEAAQLALEALAPVDDVLGAILLLEPLPDLLASVRCPDDVHPVARRAVLALGRHDLDDVTILEAVVQRDQPVVDLRADRAVADVGVDPVGEVERRAARGQVLHIAARREHEHLVLEDVELDALDELRGVRLADVALPLHQLAQPRELRVVVALRLGALLVPPVRRDPDLAHLVHGMRPDLDLEGLAVECDHRRVERLVQVVLGDRDVVVELARDRPPDRVHDPQRGVAVPDLVHEEADRVDVVDLAELRALALHLLPDAEDVLGAALELGIDARRAQLRLELVDRPLDVALTALAPGVQELRELAIRLGLEDLEREVLQLPLDLPDPETLRERGVDLHRLARDPLLLLGLQGAERAHVVQPVRELDEHDADVVGHREEHLADVLGLLLLVAVGAELGQLRDAIHHVGDLRPEPLLHVGEAELRVLGHVVQQRGGNGDRVDAELGQDLRRRDWVGDVRLSRRTHLAAVGLDREVEGALHDRQVGLRMVRPDRRHEAPAQCVEVRRAGLAARPHALVGDAGGRTFRAGAARGGARRRQGNLRIADDWLSHGRSLPRAPPALVRTGGEGRLSRRG